MIEFIIKLFTKLSSNWETITRTKMESQFLTDYISIMEITPENLFKLIYIGLYLILVIYFISLYREELLKILKILSVILVLIIVLLLIIINIILNKEVLYLNLSDTSEETLSDILEHYLRDVLKEYNRLVHPFIQPDPTVNPQDPRPGPPATLIEPSPSIEFFSVRSKDTFIHINSAYVNQKGEILTKLALNATGEIEYPRAERDADSAKLWEKVVQVDILERWGGIRLTYRQDSEGRVSRHYCIDYLKVHNRIVPEARRTYQSVLDESNGDLLNITSEQTILNAIDNLPKFEE